MPIKYKRHTPIISVLAKPYFAYRLDTMEFDPDALAVFTARYTVFMARYAVFTTRYTVFIII